MSIVICVSATEEAAAKLLEDGPRRDFVELARVTGGTILYQPVTAIHGRLRRKVTGPHVLQAWRAAASVTPGDTVFADGEHIGIPLLVFLLFRFRRSVRVVMLGHLVSRPWKRWPLAVLSRLAPRGALIVHSATQAERVQRLLGGSWDLCLVPYQVDTAYWRSQGAPSTDDVPLVLAVGSEHRDYTSLSEAVRGLDVHVLIAAGSHWARRVAVAGDIPSNVEYLDRALPFSELRGMYDSATLVVVPLADVQNQSGVTSILEAMSMGRPVITTANSGQRECIFGPFVSSTGELHEETTRDRGPAIFGGDATAGQSPDGYYVAPGDVLGLRSAILRVLDSRSRSQAMGLAGRESAEAHFPLERYIETLREIVQQPALVGSRIPRHAVTP